ncbi:response regulator [Pantoea rodasii]|uniref:Response regulator n=1 Tax=Pantoea rodasii TaxID=1076549 RepID=A0A2M9WJ97_9GAMM|nr:response regulator [Pantoea rodasii]ORM61867.1 hypothetical protein HA45_19850 [Pantoea rodasii]PJZ07589.1 response regulator [Pantoea rodasii]
MSAKVWLVDNELSVRESLGFVLKAIEYEVADFADIASFAVAVHSDEPLRGCLLVDVQTADAEELNVMVSLAARHTLLPIVIMTDQDKVEACRQAFSHGLFAIFTKPLEIEPLLETLHQAMQESEKRAQP